MRSGSLLVITTSHGLRSLLSPQFDCVTEGLSAKIAVELIIQPWKCGGSVKSAIIARVLRRHSACCVDPQYK